MFYHRLRALLTIGLIFLLLTVCDDIEGANQNRDEDNVSPVGTVGVLWAKPLWAKFVNNRCPVGYEQLNQEFCFQCPEEYQFSSFPDDDFCFYCPPDYTIGSWTDDRGGIHYACFPPAPQQ